MPRRRIFFWEEPEPESISTFSWGNEKKLASSLTIARFAFPSTGGSRIWHPMVFLHGLYPEGKRVFFAFGVTSIESMVPSLLTVRALAISSTYYRGGVARH